MEHIEGGDGSSGGLNLLPFISKLSNVSPVDNHKSEIFKSSYFRAY